MPIYKLHKSLYGLKQASRQWFARFSSVLIELGFEQSKVDSSFFIRANGTIFTHILVYVDDIVVTGNCSDTIQELKFTLDKCFKLKDLGDLKFFLGIEVAQSVKGISINQRHCALTFLEETGFLGSKPVSKLMEPSIKLTKD